MENAGGKKLRDPLACQACLNEVFYRIAPLGQDGLRREVAGFVGAVRPAARITVSLTPDVLRPMPDRRA